jgi:hypothetical protein
MSSALRFHAIRNSRSKDEENNHLQKLRRYSITDKQTFREEEELYNMIMEHREYVRGHSSNGIQREENDSNGCLIATVFLLLILLGILSYLT